jgi:hypothetical protein
MAIDAKVSCAVALAALACVCCAALPFERYQTIVDRKPFGPEPVNFDPEAAPGSAAANAAANGEMTAEQRTVEEQQLASNVRVSMINITPAGDVAVGFTDSSAKPPENYYLKVGRSQNGWTVKSADPASESVTLEKGGIDVTVKLGETFAGGGKGSKAGRGAQPMTLAASASDGLPSGPAAMGTPLGGLARLRQRRAEMRAKEQADAEKKAQADAVAAAEREEREAREAEEKRARAEREAREAEERAQQREALRQIQEQLRKAREAREISRQEEQDQEVQNEANNAE